MTESRISVESPGNYGNLNSIAGDIIFSNEKVSNTTLAFLNNVVFIGLVCFEPTKPPSWLREQPHTECH